MKGVRTLEKGKWKQILDKLQMCPNPKNPLKKKISWMTLNILKL